MIQFIIGAIVGFYIGSIGVEASVAKLNTAVDTVQEWSTSATK